MFGATFNWPGITLGGLPVFVRLFMAALGTGLAVKLMDDVLDSPLDRMRGLRNLADRLGRAAMPYALLVLVAGLYFDTRLGLALFLAAYAIGMTARPYERLPSGLLAWHEMLLAAVGLIALAGWRLGGQVLLLLVAVQLWDDMWDRSEGTPPGPWAWVSRASRPATTLLCTGCVLAAVALGYVPALAVLLAAACVWLLARKRRWRGHFAVTARSSSGRRLR